MAQINISNLTFAYEGSYDNIFEDASFQLDTDWKLGFVGRNGRGKTTFLNLLLGKYEYGGSITSTADFAYFPYDVPDHELDAIDIALAIAPELLHWELVRELSRMEMAEEVLYRPFKTLSNGERTKLLLVLLFLKENNFLLIDEPTNHLDAIGREHVGRYLSSKKGFILVSHDRAFLDGCVDHILSINRMNIDVRSGNFTSWFNNKMMQDEAELQQNEQLKKEISRLKKAARQTSDWSGKVEASKIGGGAAKGHIGRMSAKMMKRSKVIEKRQLDAAEEKEGLLKNIERADRLKLHPLEYHSQRLVSFDGVSLRYGEKTVCDKVTFDIGRGERVAIQGKNGSGKSTILKLIVGEDISYEGNFHRGSGLKISYVPQDSSFLSGRLNDFAAEREIDETLFKAILRKLDFSRVQFEKDMADFSAGQKKKVLIAGSLCESAHLYVWDEPLNYIDVFSRMQIEELLADCRSAVVFVEHDRAFAEKIATKVIML